jgi:superfamily II DNA or RNA helicase
VLRLQYGNVFTKASGTEDELFPVRRSLSFFDKKLGEVTNLFSVNPVGTELTFASGLIAHVKRELTSRKHEFEAEGEPVLDDVTKITVDPKILDGITLYDYQAPAVLKAIWKRRGIIRIPTGGGKCTRPETPVLHFDGRITRADEVQVDDLLMGPDSKPRRVTSVNFGYGPMVKIVPTKGDPWGCNDVHILTLVHTQTGEVIDIPVDEYERQSKTFKHCHKLFQPDGVDFGVEPGRFKIPPYFLGVWFGDGRRSLQTVEISKPDPEIEAACREVAALYGLGVTVDRYPGKCPSYRAVGQQGVENSLLLDLRALVGDAERIPRAYLTSSRENRRELLAGLLDTDGYLHHGFFEICQKRLGVAEGIAFLARSLGFRVTVREKIVEGEVYQRINILGDLSTIPTRIQRKQAKPRRQKKNALRTGFKVVPDGEGIYRGITIEGDGRFLLGDFTVTHNTEISGAIVKHLADEKMISTLMIVPGVSSMHQTHERWQSRGIESIGRLGDRKKELDEAHLIAGIDALSASLKRRDKKLTEWLKGCSCVLFMECQHVPAKTWELIGNSLDVEYRIGLSATPFMNPGPPEQVRDFQLIGVTGEILADVDDFVVMNRGHMATPKVHFLPVGRTPALAPSEADWRSLKKHGLVEHEKRNNMIKGTAIALAQGGARVLVLVSEILHGKGIARGVSRFVKNTFMFQGSSMLTHFRDGVELPSERMPITRVAKMLRELEDGYVLVGSPALDEDADFPDANVLIVAGAGRSFNKTIQRSGRVLRAKPGSNICHIIDFDDRSAWRLHAQANRRRELYASRYRGAKAFTIEDHHHPDEIVQLVVTGELGGNGNGGVEAVSVR